MKKVIFRSKTEWQKPNCLFCGETATLEAAYGKAMIRCCEDEDCKNNAAELAKEIGQFVPR